MKPYSVKVKPRDNTIRIRSSFDFSLEFAARGTFSVLSPCCKAQFEKRYICCGCRKEYDFGKKTSAYSDFREAMESHWIPLVEENPIICVLLNRFLISHIESLYMEVVELYDSAPYFASIEEDRMIKKCCRRYSTVLF